MSFSYQLAIIPIEFTVNHSMCNWENRITILQWKETKERFALFHFFFVTDYSNYEKICCNLHLNRMIKLYGMISVCP